MIQKVCENCNKDFVVYPSEAKRRFCCEKCRKQALFLLKVETTCAQCKAPLVKRRCEIAQSQSGISFCSTSCSCTYWNAIGRIPKKTLQGRCVTCSLPIRSSRKFCEKCRKLGSVGNMTIQSICEKYCNSPYLKSATIRCHSRKMYDASTLPKMCGICLYDKFYEVCHIKPIKGFPLETKISVVNDLSNLVALCPNCHWEIDHGITSKDKLEEVINSRESGS
jgi:hypothetical protein